MIFVTIGTERFAFNRIIQCVEEVAKNLAIENVVFQTGHSPYLPSIGYTQAFFHPSEIKSFMEQASFIVTHGGTGSVLLSLSLKKKPIIIPRLSRYGEAVDDHQLIFAEKMQNDNLAFLAQNPSELEKFFQEFLIDSSKIKYLEESNQKTHLIKFLDSLMKP